MGHSTYVLRAVSIKIVPTNKNAIFVIGEPVEPFGHNL